MIRAACIVLALALFVSSTASAAGASDDAVPESWTGRAIMRRVALNWERYASSALLRITTVSRSGRRFDRRFEALRLRAQSQPRTLIRVLSPDTLRGTTLLVLGGGRAGDQRFVYLPVSRKVRRIAAASGDERALGTDFSYSDLGVGDVEDYTHERLEDAVISGVKCFVVRSTLVDPRPGASQRLSWVARSSFVPLRVDYVRNGRPERRLEVDPRTLLALGEGAWMPRQMVMRDLLRGTRTELAVEALDTHPRIDPERLTVAYLNRLSKKIHLVEPDQALPPLGPSQRPVDALPQGEHP